MRGDQPAREGGLPGAGGRAEDEQKRLHSTFCTCSRTHRLLLLRPAPWPWPSRVSSSETSVRSANSATSCARRLGSSGTPRVSSAMRVESRSRTASTCSGASRRADVRRVANRDDHVPHQPGRGLGPTASRSTWRRFQYPSDQEQHGKNLYDQTGYPEHPQGDVPDAEDRLWSPTRRARRNCGLLFAASSVGILPSHLLKGKDRDKEMKDGYMWSGWSVFAEWSKGD